LVRSARDRPAGGTIGDTIHRDIEAWHSDCPPMGGFFTQALTETAISTPSDGGGYGNLIASLHNAIDVGTLTLTSLICQENRLGASRYTHLKGIKSSKISSSDRTIKPLIDTPFLLRISHTL
jgi:hypothetical protein